MDGPRAVRFAGGHRPRGGLLDDARALANRREPGGATEVRLGLRAADLLRFLGQLGESERLLHALSQSPALERDPALRASHLCALGNAAAARLAPAEARAAFEGALAQLAGAPERRAEVLSMLAATWFAEDRLDDAARCLEEAVSLARSPLDAAVARGSLGIVDFTRGRTATGVLTLAAAYEELVRLGSRHWAAVMLTYLGRADHERGELDLAGRRLEQAAADAQRVGVRRAEALIRLSLGALQLELGALSAAEDTLCDATALIRATCPDHEALALALRSVAARRRTPGGGTPGTALHPDAPAALSADTLLLRARAALAQHPRPQFAAAVDVLSAQPPPPQTEAWYEVRMAKRLMGGAPGEAAPLLVARDGAWFRPPGGAEVSLRRRQPLRRLLARLSEERLAAPGRAVSLPQLVSAGWPGERVLPEAGAERVYTAVATLRRLGLRASLERCDDGYRLAPELPTVWG